MALDFSLITQAPSIGERFYQGQRDVQQEAEQNMLRQQRALQFQQGQEDRALQQQERQRVAAEADRRRQAIANFSAKFAEGGYKFDRSSLAELQTEALQTRDPTLLKVAQEGFRLLDEEDEYQRIFPTAPRAPQPTAPATAPMGEPITDAETVSRARALGNMEPRYAVTSPVSPEPVAPRVANTLAPAPAAAAAPANAMLAGPVVPGALPVDPYATERQRLTALTGSSSRRVAARAEAELRALPPDPRLIPLNRRSVPVGNLMFDYVTQQYIPRPVAEGAAAPAAGARVPPLLNLTPEQVQTLAERERTIAEAKRKPTAPRGAAAPAAGPAPARPEGALPQKEIDKREATYPKVTAVLRGFETNADTLIDKLTRLRDNPGLSGITGLVFGRTPAITPEARDALAELDTILARGGFAELAAMRQASPTGGALGNISNREVDFLRSAFGSLDRVQDTDTFKKKINEVIKQLQTSKRNVLEEYENTYAYRKARAAAGAGLSPEDKQALDWANQNPNSPYAAEIKKRLGM